MKKQKAIKINLKPSNKVDLKAKKNSKEGSAKPQKTGKTGQGNF